MGFNSGFKGLTRRVYVTCLDPRTNSDDFCVQTLLIFIKRRNKLNY